MKKKYNPLVCTKRELMMLLGANEITFVEMKLKAGIPHRRKGWFTFAEVEKLKKLNLAEKIQSMEHDMEID